ncbi:DNA polymerase IV, partial [Patescibacteria group bacterium]|nr:DNA polymerase IV [Patescibacteria group bacterium]
IGPNKLLAKIASNYDKPDGLTVVTTAQAAQFLASLPIRVLPGVGPVTEQRLRAHNIQSVSDVRRFSHGELTGLFGKWGGALYHTCRGLDDSPLHLSRVAKSIGKHLTFAQDTLDARVIVESVMEMCEELVSRLRAQGFTGFRTVVITVRFSTFSTRSRSYTRATPTSSVKQLKVDALRLLLPFFDWRENPGHLLVRLIGVRLEKLERV